MKCDSKYYIHAPDDWNRAWLNFSFLEFFICHKYFKQFPQSETSL